MNWLAARIKGITLTAGVLTSSLLYAAIVPQHGLDSNFGDGLYWDALLGLVAGILIYGAFHPLSRALVLTVVGLSKVVFIGVLLSHGTRYLHYQAGIALFVDSLFLLVFCGYLVGSRKPFSLTGRHEGEGRGSLSGPPASIGATRSR